VIAEHASQRLVRQMRSRMVRLDRQSARRVDRDRHLRARQQLAILHRHVMNVEVAEPLLRVGDARQQPIPHLLALKGEALLALATSDA